MTDNQRAFIQTLTDMAERDTKAAEDHPSSATRRAIAQWSISQLETTAADHPPAESATARESAKQLRTRIKAIPRPRRSRAA